MQVMYMKRDGVPVGRGTCIVCIKFFLYELALCVFYVVAMVRAALTFLQIIIRCSGDNAGLL